MKYTVLYGGTFHPVHNGHLQMAAAAAAWPHTQEVWVLPSFSPVHKSSPDAKQNAEHRLQMCRLAFADVPKTSVCDIELRASLSGYTYDTLQSLKALYPQRQFAFLMGTDMLFCFEKWYKASALLQQLVLLVVLRAGDSHLQMEQAADALRQKYGANVVLLPQRVQQVSSTQVRQCLANGQSTADLLPPSVQAYIFAHRLYKTGEEK